jgi:hypothetical protein
MIKEVYEQTERRNPLGRSHLNTHYHVFERPQTGLGLVIRFIGLL